MKIILLVTFGVLAIALAALSLWRQLDHRADRIEARRLVSTQPTAPPTFDSSLVAALPEPARRFFEFAIMPGTPLYTVAEIEMRGRFGMGDKTAPGYLDMSVTQVLAAPEGFVWKMRAGRGVTRLSGSDSGGWTRFWLMHLMPVARFGCNEYHRRSAFARHVAEAVFWTPAALLPSSNVSWEAVDANTARVSIRHEGLEQAVDVSVDDKGRATRVVFLRWSDANPEKRYQLQPFGGELSEFREFSGFRLPTHVEAGNHFGTDDYFPFFVVEVSDVRFPVPDQR